MWPLATFTESRPYINQHMSYCHHRELCFCSGIPTTVLNCCRHGRPAVRLLKSYEVLEGISRDPIYICHPNVAPPGGLVHI
jgi:hypothetical protein